MKIIRILNNKITTLFYSFIIVLSIILLGLFNEFVILDLELVEQTSDIKHIYLIEKQEEISSLNISGPLNMENQPTGGPSNASGLPGDNNNEHNISTSGSDIRNSNSSVGLDSGVPLHSSSTSMVTLQSASLQAGAEPSDQDMAITETAAISLDEIVEAFYNTRNATGRNIFSGYIAIEDIPAEFILTVADLIQATTGDSIKLYNYVLAVSQSPDITLEHLLHICFPGDLIQLLNQDVNPAWLDVNSKLALEIIDNHIGISDDINVIIAKYLANYQPEPEEFANPGSESGHQTGEGQDAHTESESYSDSGSDMDKDE